MTQVNVPKSWGMSPPPRGVLLEVAQERARQDERFGPQNHDPFLWLTILGEEYGEACRGAYEAEITTSMREELIQVAAVAVAAVESIDRNYVGVPS